MQHLNVIRYQICAQSLPSAILARKGVQKFLPAIFSHAEQVTHFRLRLQSVELFSFGSFS